jgi:4a-hydroxytetrahydrobiopterin dehydratase
MQTLNIEEINKRLKDFDGWVLDQESIKKEWTFGDFKEALKFINRVGALAESHNHHPELFNVYNKVTLRFNTHFAGGITEKDFKIAKDIDKL